MNVKFLSNLNVEKCKTERPVQDDFSIMRVITKQSVTQLDYALGGGLFVITRTSSQSKQGETLP